MLSVCCENCGNLAALAHCDDGGVDKSKVQTFIFLDEFKGSDQVFVLEMIKNQLSMRKGFEKSTLCHCAKIHVQEIASLRHNSARNDQLSAVLVKKSS